MILIDTCSGLRAGEGRHPWATSIYPSGPPLLTLPGKATFINSIFKVFKVYHQKSSRVMKKSTTLTISSILHKINILIYIKRGRLFYILVGKLSNFSYCGSREKLLRVVWRIKKYYTSHKIYCHHLRVTDLKKKFFLAIFSENISHFHTKVYYKVSHF